MSRRVAVSRVQRAMLLSSPPDDITGEEGVGVALTHAGMRRTAGFLRALGYGVIGGPGLMYWNNARGLALRMELLSEEP